MGLPRVDGGSTLDFPGIGYSDLQLLQFIRRARIMNGDVYLKRPVLAVTVSPTELCVLPDALLDGLSGTTSPVVPDTGPAM